MTFGRSDIHGLNSGKLWLWFFILLGFNALLSWGPWDVWQRFWLYPAAWILELVFVFYFPSFAGTLSRTTSVRNEPGKRASGRTNPRAWDEGMKNFPSFQGKTGWMILLLAGLAVFLRFYGLVSVPVWPTWDDANYSYFAVGLSEKLSWPLLIGHEKTMPLFTWLQGLFFQVDPPSLASLWLYTASLSLLAVILGVWAARRYLARVPALVYAALLAVGFWPIYFGKFDAYLGEFQWCVEFLLLGILGLFLKAAPRYSLWLAILLGLGVGGSLYSSMLFLGPAALVTVGMFLFCRKKPERGMKVFLAYLLPALVLSIPMDLAFLQNLTGGHVFTYSVFSHQKSPWDRRWATLFSYFTAPFWGPIDGSYWSFSPLWGGFFNPLWDALFFLGLATWRVYLGKTWRTWWAVFLGLLLLPAFFFNTLECFRTDLIMPLCLVPMVAGLGVLFSTLVPSARKGFFLLVLALSLGMDGYHFFGVFHQWSIHMIPGIQIKSPERYRAYQILRETAKRQGPGFIFSDFVSDAYDQSLLVSAYPFNAARNPRLDPQKARWAAILTDLHYLKALEARFPGARSQVVTDPSDTNILCLVLVPVSSPAERETFLKWRTVHLELQDLYGQMPYVVENPDFTPIYKKLWSLYPACEKDPLLKGWILEKGLDLLLVNPDMTPAQWLLGRPAEATRSFPFLDRKFAVVYHRLGLALLQNGDAKGARECFRRASLFDPKYDLKKWLALTKGNEK